MESKLRECKVYLWKHGLGIARNRAICVVRIREHWRLKDGNGYTVYPRSSFIIDCISDVCKGDVVLFRQKVYEKFDKVTRRGRVLGSRTVAKRVVKESNGAAKQQHTFTVEVLWSSRVRKVPSLFPLLVKGSNLYKQNTYRQDGKMKLIELKCFPRSIVKVLQILIYNNDIYAFIYIYIYISIQILKCVKLLITYIILFEFKYIFIYLFNHIQFNR